jgi:hypothetical protein
MSNRQYFEWIEITPGMMFEDKTMYLLKDKQGNFDQANGWLVGGNIRNHIKKGTLVLLPVTDPLYTIEDINELKDEIYELKCEIDFIKKENFIQGEEL